MAEGEADSRSDAVRRSIARLRRDQNYRAEERMLDERRPALILTREARLHLLTRITVAPITSTVRGLSTEVPVGARNGLDHESVISCDNLVTVHVSAVGASIGLLFDDEEEVLARAISDAFDLAPW